VITADDHVRPDTTMEVEVEIGLEAGPLSSFRNHDFLAAIADPRIAREKVLLPRHLSTASPLRSRLRQIVSTIRCLLCHCGASKSEAYQHRGHSSSASHIDDSFHLILPYNNQKKLFLSRQSIAIARTI
jgi:hypothetical protein